MDGDEGRILYLIEKLRRITLEVQVAPFLVAALYIAVLFSYMFVSESARSVLDTLFYVSPVTSLILLAFSRTLKLCKWHRRACILPLLPQVFVFVDYHVFELTHRLAYVALLVPISMAALLFVAAWNVFLKPKHNGRKERTARDSRLLQIQT